jgi:deazaflavin-dependent oxidoreductase (nitroreductase family)
MSTEELEAFLAAGGIADIITTGRKTGRPRRTEIFFHQFDGGYFIGGRPGFKRDWLANLSAHPRFILHLKRGVRADLPATAEVVTDVEGRRAIFHRMLTESWGVPAARAEAHLEQYVESSPLVRFVLD